MAGSNEPGRVELPGALAFASARPVNLRGQPVGPSVAVPDNRLTLPLRPFAPVSVILTGKK